MLRIIVWAVIGLLALYGCTEGLCRLTRAMWMPRNLRRILVVPLTGHKENMEQIMHMTTSRMLIDQGASEVMLIDVGLDEFSRRLAEELSKRSGYCPVHKPEELETTLLQLDEK